jgi:hypothetical protein
MTKLQRLPEGDGDAKVLVSTIEINRLIDRLNAQIDMTISPQGMGKIVVGEGNSALDLGPLDERIKTIETAQNAIIRALYAIGAEAVCNSDGTITFTIRLPGLPAPA